MSRSQRKAERLCWPGLEAGAHCHCKKMTSKSQQLRWCAGSVARHQNSFEGAPTAALVWLQQGRGQGKAVKRRSHDTDHCLETLRLAHRWCSLDGTGPGVLIFSWTSWCQSEPLTRDDKSSKSSCRVLLQHCMSVTAGRGLKLSYHCCYMWSTNLQLLTWLFPDPLLVPRCC